MAYINQIVCLVAVLTSSTLAVPVYEEHPQIEEEHHVPAHYEFKYGVKDEHTHDIKEQAEKRDGDKVEGYYKLVEPDGTIRTVKYSSDKHSGFIAHVEISGHASHPVPIKKFITPLKKVVYPEKKVIYPLKYQSYEPAIQRSYIQETSHYDEPARVYSNEELSQSGKGSLSYSSSSFGGSSEGYGHYQ